jgi:hypothetical protein
MRFKGFLIAEPAVSRIFTNHALVLRDVTFELYDLLYAERSAIVRDACNAGPALGSRWLEK